MIDPDSRSGPSNTCAPARRAANAGQRRCARTSAPSCAPCRWADAPEQRLLQDNLLAPILLASRGHLFEVLVSESLFLERKTIISLSPMPGRSLRLNFPAFDSQQTSPWPDRSTGIRHAPAHALGCFPTTSARLIMPCGTCGRHQHSRDRSWYSGASPCWQAPDKKCNRRTFPREQARKTSPKVVTVARVHLALSA